MTTAAAKESKQNSSPAPPTAGGPGSTAPNANATGLPEITNWRLLVRMFTFIKPVKWLLVANIVVILIAVAIDTSAENVRRIIVNLIADIFGVQTAAAGSGTMLQRFVHGPMEGVLIRIGLLGGLVICGAVIGYLRQLVNMKFTMEMVYHMRAAVYDRLQRVGFSFHDEHSSGALINRALSDLQNVRAFLQNSLTMTVEIAAVVVAYNVLLATINWEIALAAFIPIPLWIWYINGYSKKMQPAQAAFMQSGDDLVTVFTENIGGVHVVKAFATEETEIKKYNKAADIFFDRVMAVVDLTRNFVPTIRGIATASHLSLFLLGGILVIRGHLKVGDLLLFGTAMGRILAQLQQIPTISDQYQKAIVSARRFFEVLDAPSTVPEVDDAPPLPRGKGAVEFNFVTFGYAPEKPVVHNIAFDVEGGSVVALVGPTGAGKSTIVQLLARFYDPQAGQIFIDGVDIKKISLSSLRQNIGFVFQETFLFSDTVANNIRYGHPDATMGDVEAAARLAQAHDFIMELPQGYDSMLGERGSSLSGGQRQRLAIARALVSNPRILVLDDALAAVDPETEHLISRALELMMVDRTVFIIAHRLSTVKAADVVIVIENGRITQAGTHKELLREKGHYRHIAEVQLAYQETEIIAEVAKKTDREAVARNG
jgi:ATP-binding cassette subfamily B protein